MNGLGLRLNNNKHGSFTNNFQYSKRRPGKNTISIQANLFQQFPKSDSNGQNNKSSSSHKKAIPFKQTFSKRSSGRTFKTFFKCMESGHKNQNILNIVEGYEIPFISMPNQVKPPHKVEMNAEEERLIDLEIEELLKKGTILNVSSLKDQFLSSLFLVNKKDGGHRPVINLKK